jgi:hypothetical protein
MIINRSADKLVITENYHPSLGVASFITAIGIVTLLLSFTVFHAVAVALGLIFTAVGCLGLWSSEKRTTQINSSGGIVITYTRYFGHKVWVRKLRSTNIRKVDYIKGFTGTELVGKESAFSSIYLDTKSEQQIGIVSTYRISWKFNKFGIPVAQKNTPLDEGAKEIADFLKVPLNIIDHSKIKKAIGAGIYNQTDIMLPILQRPTQAQLDNEFNNEDTGD